MEAKYTVEFMYPDGGTVILGIFSSREIAEEAIERTKKDRGYLGEFGNPNRYLISRFVVDNHVWLGEMGVIHE